MKEVVRQQNMETSYENLLDTGFRQKYDLAMNALSELVLQRRRDMEYMDAAFYKM